MNMHTQHSWPDKTTRPAGMLVSVVKLRHKGERITKQDYDDAVPIVGRLF